jgi:hypothetical protein
MLLFSYEAVFSVSDIFHYNTVLHHIISVVMYNLLCLISYFEINGDHHH